jgi:hypothetical protein
MTTSPLATDGTALLKDDPWLQNYVPRLRSRHEYLKSVLGRIEG